MFKSRFFLENRLQQKGFNTFSRKLVKQFVRNYKGTTFITFSTISGQSPLRMRRNGHKTNFGLQFDTKFESSVPDFLYGEKF